MRTSLPQPVAHTATVQGAEVRYFSYGEPNRPGTELVVMVHGLRGTHHGLELLATSLLAESEVPRQVVIPDLPGYGASTPFPGARHDVAGYAGVVRELLHRLDAASRPVSLVGHSFGSVVAADAAATDPGMFRRLVLVNAITSPPLRGPRAVLSALTSGYYALGSVLPSKLGHAWLGNRCVVLVASRAMTRSKDPDLRRFIDESHLRYFSRFHSPAVLNETYQASIGSTVADYATTLRVPTLLVAGADDDIAPLDGQRAVAAEMDSAELVVLRDVGHLVHYETPSRAAAAIQGFLAAPPRRAAS